MSKSTHSQNDSQVSIIESLQTKQKLIQEYYTAISEQELNRKSVNCKIKKLKERLHELIYSDANPAQLKLFVNIDEFLVKIEAGSDDND